MTGAGGRFGFRLKAGLAALLVALADWLFFERAAGGAALGAFALAWLLAVVAAHPGLRKNRRSLLAAGVAGAFALVLIDHPTLLAWVLFWTALTSAVLLSRVARVGDAWRWSLRLAYHVVAGAFRPLLDLRRLARAGGGLLPGSRPWRLATLLALPAGGGLLFVGLFAAANPVIARAFAALPPFSPVRLIFWALVLVAAWTALRPSLLRRRPAVLDLAAPVRIGVPTASITLSLFLFNALFAVQNGLDLAFLWSGAPPPAGVTLAEYAHRGAYPLIATALLAGGFVLVFLAPGSAAARVPVIRRLVAVWTAQNLVLVASSILRTLDYIDAYSLTRFRIAALAWMALVALGLVLIAWRMMRGKSAAWLINANATAALTVLAVASVADLGGFAAAWNVRHAREVGGRGTHLDFCYLRSLGDSALFPLLDLERDARDREVRARAAFVRDAVMTRLEKDQARWRTWSLRGAARLERAQARLGPAPPPADARRSYCGAPPEPPPANLTSQPGG